MTGIDDAGAKETAFIREVIDMLDDVQFESTAKPSPEEIVAFYERQGHATTHSHEKLQRMVKNTFCFVTARRGGELIGLARGVTDGVTGRLLECKLDPAYQGPACVTRTDGRIEHDEDGIARRMAELVIEALIKNGVDRVEVLAYGTEEDFCAELGFKKIRGVVAMELPADTSVGKSHAASTGGVA